MGARRTEYQIVGRYMDGKEVKVNAGNSYIGILNKNTTTLYSEGQAVSFTAPVSTTAAN